jgi:hypothetical protein
MTNLTSTLTVKLVDDVSKPARTVAQALKDAETAAKAVAKGLAGTGASNQLAASLTKLKASKGDIEQVANAWKDYAKANNLAAESSKWTKSQTADVKAWERQQLSALREVRREQQQFYRSQREQAERAKRPGEYIGAAAYIAIAAAHKVAEVGKQAVEAGAERQHVRVGAINAGIGPDELQRIEGAAIRAKANAPNMSVSEIMELHKETRSAVTKPEEAFHIIDDLAKAGSVLKGMGMDTSGLSQIVKGGESLGLMNDPKRFKDYLSGQVKSMQVMGKTITPEQIYEAAKYSKSSGALLSDRFINTTLPSLIQELHGQSAGDALSMVTKTLRGGLQHQHLPVQRLQELGLLADPDKIIKTKKTGQIMGYAGKVKDDDILASDPKKWFQETFKPAAVKAGYKTLADQVLLLSQVLPQRAANLGRLFIQQEEAFEQHAKNYDNASDLDHAVKNQRKDPTANVGALSKAIDDLEAAITGPAMPAIAAGMSGLASSISGLAAFAKESPNLAATVAEITAFGAAAVALKAAPFAAATLGMKGLAGVLTTFAAALTPVLAILTVAGVMKSITDAMENARLTPKEEGKTYTSDVLGNLSNWMQGKGSGRDEKYVDHFDEGKYRWGVYKNWLQDQRDHEHDKVWTPPTNAPLPPRRPADLTPAAPVSVNVDHSQIDNVGPTVEKAKQALDTLGAPVAVNVDSSSISAAQAEVEKLLSSLARVGSMAANVKAQAAKASAGLAASLGASQRGHFGSPAVQGE